VKNTSKKIFHYKNLEIETHPDVYDPAEDTFLLLEALEVHNNNNVLEIGTGCGIIALECARCGAKVVCTDSNPHTIKLVQNNIHKNKSKLEGYIEFRYGNLFSVIRKDERFDTIIFNPPYLPTKNEDLISGNEWFDHAVNGGKNGLTTTKKYLDGIKKYLSKHGKAYFIFSTLSSIKKLDAILTDNNLRAEIVSSKWFNDERLDVFCIRTNV
jgi:release factor glutamine methyltransferase